MNSSLAAESWMHTFNGALPAGFLLRQRYPDRWLRIHSLPESKRYPGCPAEYEELLNRHNTVASYVLGDGSPCSLFVARFGEDRDWSDESLTSLIGSIPTHAFASEDPDEPMQFFSAQVGWRRSAFDKLICAIADDRIGPVLFANTAAGSIYAPYDGGADMFFPSSAAVAAARVQFRLWLSARKDGL